MKKLLGLVLSGMLVISMGGCSNDTDNTGVKEEQITQENKNDNKLNQVLVDSEYCTITVTDMYEDATWSEAGFKVTIENKSDKNLLIGVDEVSVDGFMNDPFWATEVNAGKKVNSKIYWYTNTEEGNVKSKEDLKNIEMTFNISDNEDFNSYGEYEVNIK